MSTIVMASVLVVALISSLALGVWVSIALFVTGMVGVLEFSNAPVFAVLGTNIWGASTEWSLAALPLFIWMEIGRASCRERGEKWGRWVQGKRSTRKKEL